MKSSPSYCWPVLIIPLLALACLASEPPQLAFSIQSGQIPGGIFPTSLGVDSSGNVYVASQWTVVKLARNGSYLTRWGSQGTGPGQFSYSGPMAIDRANNIFVIDDYNDRVEKFDSQATFSRVWGTNGTGPGQFDYPLGLALDSNGLVYVSDSFNSRVEVFTGSGGFLRSFGSIGTNTGQFSFSGPIAIDSSNKVYVADIPGGSYDNFRLQKFDTNGTFLAQWGSHGVNPDPSGGLELGGMATDPANNVYVADGAHNTIQKFNSDGLFLVQWGSYGTGPGQFNNPSGIAIDPSGNYIYVSDYYNARINVFAYSPLDPILYQSPTNQTVPAGSTLNLAVGVFGAPSLSYQWRYNGADIAGATDATLVFSNVTLAASGTYSVIVTNTLGTAASSNAAISVLPVVVTTLPVTAISATGAVLNGTASLGSNPSTVWFEWGTSTNYGNIAGFTNLNANSRSSLRQPLTDLSGSIVYHYRLVGSNDLGVVSGGDVAFQVGLKPVVTTLPVTSIGSDSVLLNASVNPEGRDTSVFFRWGIGNSYAHNTTTNQVGNGATPLLAHSQITGLAAGSYYTVQAVASNELGTVSGAPVNFVAPPWTVLPVPPQRIWKSMATSADGSKVAAVANDNRIYVSADSGLTWTSSNVVTAPWQAIVMAADGSRLVAAAGGSSATLVGPAFVSTNGGNTWIKAATPDRTWAALAVSGDGLKIAGVDVFGQRVLTSTNGGLNWTTNSPPISAMWSSIASSADGQKLIVAAGGINGTTNGPLYTSSNAGLSWTSNNMPTRYWRCVASSADGQTLFAAVGGRNAGQIYRSTNGGATWAETSAPSTNWQALTVSADGTKIAALENIDGKPIYTSTNSGVSWQSQLLPPAIWSAIAASADGARLFASGDQNILMLQTTPVPELETSLAGSQFVLSWVVPSAPFYPQYSSGLFPPQWVGLTNLPAMVFTNLHYQVTLPVENPVRFYRLSQ